MRFYTVEFLDGRHTTTTARRARQHGALGLREVTVPHINIRAFSTLTAARAWVEAGAKRVLLADAPSHIRRYARAEIRAVGTRNAWMEVWEAGRMACEVLT